MMENIIKDILGRAKQEKSFSYLVDFYYREYEDEGGLNMDATGRESWPSFREMMLPVEKRPSGIFDAISELLSVGYDIEDAFDLFNALMCAVGNVDYYMVEFLLKHGSNPERWDGYDECEWGKRETNWYLEDVDIAIMDALTEKEPDVQLLQALADTARVLVHAGGLKNFGGMCLDIDEKGNIDIHRLRLKY